ncbi:MAG: hypothetical protein BWY75_00674 [bacterium ADurb.Bin425]|nr:MAG: hypothetical protein BWY75_00674 [bacterium ADurb.Bin425]
MAKLDHDSLRDLENPKSGTDLRDTAAAPEKLERAYAKGKARGGFFQSRFLAGLSIFAALSLGLQFLSIEKLKPSDFPVRTWTTWAISEFFAQPAQPKDVVFLGSSLMLVPLDGTDADFLGKQIDASQHHRSIYFEDAFKKASGKSVSTYNFALPGEMPSDAYLITDFLLKEKRAPKVLVYGVGPRDFMDNLLPSPAATDPYKYLSRFGDLSGHADLLMSDWQERLNWELARLCYVYGNHGQIALDAARSLRPLIDKVAPRPANLSEVDRIAFRRKVLPDYLPFEVNPQECFFRPTDPANRPGFMDNIQEYRKRYKTLKMSTFTAQMRFLKDLIAIANERGTHVVLVAMPITQVNRELLPDASWNLYKSELAKLAAQSQSVTFKDLHAEGKGKFALSDFQDTVHLHSGGGAKLLSEIAQIMANDPVSRKALEKNGGDQ